MHRTDLAETLELVKPALATGGPIPIFGCYCFDGKQVYGYNDQFAIIAPCKTKHSFALDGDTLLGMVKNSRAEEVEFEQDDDRVLIKMGKSRIRLSFMTEDEFVFEIPEHEAELGYPLTEQLIEGLGICLETTSKDTALPSLMGVTIDIPGNGEGPEVLYSCDGDAISKFELSSAEAEGSGVFLLPNDFVEAILRVAAKTEHTDGVLMINQDWAVADFKNGYIVYGRIPTIDKPFDHESSIKNTLTEEPSFIPHPQGLEDALSRACVISDRETVPTEIVIEEGKFKLITESGSIGVVKDYLKVKGKHEDRDVKVSATLLQRSVKITDEIAVLDNCVVMRKEQLLQVLGNIIE